MTMIGLCGMLRRILLVAAQKEIPLHVTGVAVRDRQGSAPARVVSQAQKIVERRQEEIRADPAASQEPGVTGHHPEVVHLPALVTR